MNSILVFIVSMIIICSTIYILYNYYYKSKSITENFADNTVILKLNEVNCYNYMMNDNDKKNWIDTTSENKDKRLRVLSTLRTNTTTSGGLYENNVSATDACYIPTEIANTLFNINIDQNNCTLYNNDNTKSITFETTNNGCKIDFDNPNFNTKEKFNEFLDMAYTQYDSELINEIANLTNIKKNLTEHCNTMRVNKLTLENENQNLDTFITNKQNDINNMNNKLNALNSLVNNNANFDTIMKANFSDQSILTYNMQNDIKKFLGDYITAKQVLSDSQNEQQRLNNLESEIENFKTALNLEYNNYINNIKP